MCSRVCVCAYASVHVSSWLHVHMIEVHLQVKLVVIDSIAAHFRHGFECMTLRNRILGGLSQSLIMIATRYKLAVS